MNCFITQLLLLASILTISGCQKQDEIRAYDVERIGIKNQLPPGHSELTSKKVPERMLGAIVPVGDKAWFFKISGAPAAVNRQQEKLLQLMGSLSNDDKNSPLTWKLPEGWRQERGTGKMGALFTIRFDDDEKRVLNISQLKIFGNNWEEYLLLNINRWRKQVGLQNISVEELGKKESHPDDNIHMMVLKNDIKIVLTNFLGHKQSNGMRPPFANMSGGSFSRPAKQPTVPASSSLKYTVPKGWAQGRLSSMRKAAFEVKEEDKKVEITVIPSGGELLANTVIWCQQVGLKPIKKDELKELIKPITIDGHEGVLIELIGKKDQTILVAVVKTEQAQWFIKMKGDRSLVIKEKVSFIQFIKSITF